MSACPATLQLHTGVSIDVAVDGVLVQLRLGTENQNLPSFITIHPDSDVRTYGAGFLPASHQDARERHGLRKPPSRLLDDESSAPVRASG